MIGINKLQKDLLNYQVDLDQRVRQDHLLRKISTAVYFSFVWEEIAESYGDNGNVSVDPCIVMKMKFLMFFDDVSSERELMRIIPERLDYLWFLGYGFDDELPGHSMMSKAMRRWEDEVFEALFVRVVGQCVTAGLLGGKKIHVNANFIAANASKDSEVRGPPEWIAALSAGS